MFNPYFGFSDSPFENTLDQRFLFLSEDHKEVLAALLYFINENKAFALLCGDVGTGKTMLVNCFLEKLPTHVIPIIISNPAAEYQEILLYVARNLGITDTPKSGLELVDEVKKALINAAAEGRKYVLIIDEAHLLSDQSLEHMRLLSNIETPVRKLLQILLVGQYELSSKLEKPEMRQLRQRISINRFLSPLDSSESIQYIDHRLKVVGSSFHACFESDCNRFIYKLTNGVPRLINQICDNALLICKAEGHAKITKKVLGKADEALRSDIIFTPRSFKTAKKGVYRFLKPLKPLPIAIACLVFLMLTGVLSYTTYFGKHIVQTGTLQHTEAEVLSDAISQEPQAVENEDNISIAPDPQFTLSDDRSQSESQECSPPPKFNIRSSIF